MVKKNFVQVESHPSSLKGSVLTARNFFISNKGKIFYKHGKRVLDLALKNKVIDRKIIDGEVKASEEERNFHYVLSQVMLYHSLNMSAMRDMLASLRPEPLNNSVIYVELENFEKITRLIRSGAPISELIEVLNNGNPPLALLAILVDTAQTHIDISQTTYFIKEKGSSYSELFRYYSSREDANRAFVNAAHFGEKIFAPVAELFGFPKLAGDIFMQAYSINHPYIHKYVMDHQENEELQKRLSITQSCLRKIKNGITDLLKRLNISADIHFRLQKHPGKQMKKLLTRLMKEHPDIAEIGKEDSQSKIKKQKKILSNFDFFGFFNDLVALRIVVNKTADGRDINKLSEDEQVSLTADVKDIVANSLRLVFHPHVPNINETFYNKDNGYKSWHIDVDPKKDDLLKFEIQVKTSLWHQIAQDGGAAHYFYLNGYSDREFLDSIKAAYHQLITGKKKC